MPAVLGKVLNQTNLIGSQLMWRSLSWRGHCILKPGKYTLCGKRQNYRENKKISCCQGFGGSRRGLRRWGRGHFQGGDSLLCGLRGICQNPQGYTTQRVNLNVNCRLQLVIMHPRWFFSCNKCVTLRKALIITGETVCPGEREHKGTLCHFCTIFLYT